MGVATLVIAVVYVSISLIAAFIMVVFDAIASVLDAGPGPSYATSLSATVACILVVSIAVILQGDHK